jgi:hypothetical protein
MDLANHCAPFPGLSLLNTRAVQGRMLLWLKFRRLLALKANEWLITTHLNFHEWTWPTTEHLFLDCHFWIPELYSTPRPLVRHPQQPNCLSCSAMWPAVPQQETTLRCLSGCMFLHYSFHSFSNKVRALIRQLLCEAVITLDATAVRWQHWKLYWDSSLWPDAFIAELKMAFVLQWRPCLSGILRCFITC